MCPLGASLLGSPGHVWNRALMVCHCLLVETDQGLVLIDTGLGTADLGPGSRLPRDFRLMSNPQADSDTALSHVKRLGFSPSDVRHLFPTHLDLDHAGGLSDFPEATVHVYEQEYEAAMTPVRGDKGRYVAQQWAHGPLWELHKEPDGDTWYGFDAVQPIAALGDDLAIVPLTGHSAGHCGIAIRVDGAWVLHAGDAFFHRSELTPGVKPPFLTRVFERRVERHRSDRLHNVQRLQQLQAEHSDEVQVICSHDPELLRKAAPSL